LTGSSAVSFCTCFCLAIVDFENGGGMFQSERLYASRGIGMPFVKRRGGGRKGGASQTPLTTWKSSMPKMLELRTRGCRLSLVGRVRAMNVTDDCSTM
jgi:hypothetical protein